MGLKIVPEVQHLQLSPNPYSPGRNMVSILVSFLLDCFRCMRMCVHTCVCDLHSSVTCLQFTMYRWHVYMSPRRAHSRHFQMPMCVCMPYLLKPSSTDGLHAIFSFSLS